MSGLSMGNGLCLHFSANIQIRKLEKGLAENCALACGGRGPAGKHWCGAGCVLYAIGKLEGRLTAVKGTGRYAAIAGKATVTLRPGWLSPSVIFAPCRSAMAAARLSPRPLPGRERDFSSR
jgi:hypothetical protein